MDIILAAFLAGPAVLPAIDRASLNPQAQAETIVQRAVTPPPRPVAWRPAATTLDSASITSICRAARDHSDPAGFIARLSHAYQLSPAERLSLRTSCSADIAGRDDRH